MIGGTARRPEGRRPTIGLGPKPHILQIVMLNYPSRAAGSARARTSHYVMLSGLISQFWLRISTSEASIRCAQDKFCRWEFLSNEVKNLTRPVPSGSPCSPEPHPAAPASDPWCPIPEPRWYLRSGQYRPDSHGCTDTTPVPRPLPAPRGAGSQTGARPDRCLPERDHRAEWWEVRCALPAGRHRRPGRWGRTSDEAAPDFPADRPDPPGPTATDCRSQGADGTSGRAYAGCRAGLLPDRRCSDPAGSHNCGRA